MYIGLFSSCPGGWQGSRAVRRDWPLHKAGTVQLTMALSVVREGGKEWSDEERK